MENKIKLHYWKIRGLAAPIISLLEYLKLPYEVHHYTDGETWHTDKAQLIEQGFATPNLPYMEATDGSKMSESSAIMHSLASEHGPELVPSTSCGRTKVLMVEGIALDYMRAITVPMYDSKTVEEALAKVEGNLRRHQSKTNYFKTVLAKGHWILGEKLSYLDFFLAEMLEKLVVMEADFKRGFVDADTLKVFQGYLARFANLEGVRQYRDSERFMKRPFNLVQLAVWG